MEEASNKSEQSAEEILSALESQWPLIKIPGYWDSLVENCENWAAEVSNNKLWNEIKKLLPDWKSEHRKVTGNPLLSVEGLMDFTHKGKRRILTKIINKVKTDESFKNIALGTSDPPIPQLNDLVRTRISCQYIDGVEFIANKIVEVARNENVFVDREKMGSLEGYFAQHIIIEDTVNYKFMGESSVVTINCEVQIGTALSTAIWNSTHKIYEIFRESFENPSDWQWNPKDPRFISNQIGHMIHLADGLIVGLRDSKKSNGKKGTRNGLK